MATKAIHLEAVSDLSTDAFLAALRRFFGRRGKSSHLYSDNGTNFVGAAKKMNEYEKAIRKLSSLAGTMAALQNTTKTIISPFNEGTAVYLDHLGKMDVTSSKWNMVVYYDLTTYIASVSQLTDLIERERPPKKFEDAELQTILDGDDTLGQKQMAEILNVAQQTISDRLKAMGKIQKCGKWVPHELNEK